MIDGFSYYNFYKVDNKGCVKVGFTHIQFSH